MGYLGVSAITALAGYIMLWESGLLTPASVVDVPSVRLPCDVWNSSDLLCNKLFKVASLGDEQARADLRSTARTAPRPFQGMGTERGGGKDLTPTSPFPSSPVVSRSEACQATCRIFRATTSTATSFSACQLRVRMSAGRSLF